jgi:hypothetical protein
VFAEHLKQGHAEDVEGEEGGHDTDADKYFEPFKVTPLIHSCYDALILKLGSTKHMHPLNGLTVELTRRNSRIRRSLTLELRLDTA